MGMDEESGEQLRKSCDYCARMKRACDGQVPCALCCRRGKTCERSVRRKSGPAKGAKYAPRRSKLEKQTAAAADANVSGTAGTTPGGKAKNRGQGVKKRDVRGKGSDGVGVKAAPRSAIPRRQKQAKTQEEGENPGDGSLSSPSEDLPHDAEAKQHRYFSPDVGARDDDSPREARLESPVRNEANEKDSSAREKDIQRSVKKRKSAPSKVSASAPADPDSPRKKRVPSPGVSAEEVERRMVSNRPEIRGASAPASSPTERPCVFPGESDGTASVGPREHATVANEDEQFRRGHHNQQQQLKRDPWQQGASAEESQRKSDGAAKQVVGECERSPGAKAIEAAPPVSQVNDGVRKYPVTVSPTREDDGLPGWEEPPPRVRAWEPTMERRDIDAYYRQYSGISAQLGRVKPGYPQAQQDQAVPLAPKELLMMLRPNDKDIIGVIIDDKRTIAKKESAPPLEAASSRGSPNTVAVPAHVQVPRIVSSSSSNNGSSDLQAREQAKELLAKIRRDAEAHAKAAHDDELAPKSAAIVSPGARPISGGNGSSNGPTGRDQVGEAMAHEIRRPVGVEPACRDRPQDWTGPNGFCRTLPPLQRDRGVFQGYSKDREYVGSEGSRSRLDVGNGGGDGGGRGHNDRERPSAAPAFGPRDLVEGCLVPEKTEGGMRGRDVRSGGEGGYWRPSQPRTAPGSLSVPTGCIHVDYRGDRAGYVLPPFRENERKQALMSYPNRGGSWGLSIPQHPGMRTWPSAPIVGPPTLPPPPVVKTAPMHSHDPPRPRVPHGDFYLPNGDHRFSGARGGAGGDGMNTGFWKGNMWSLGTLSERRSGSEFMHPRQERSHPELSYPVGDRPGVHEAEYNHHHHRSWPSQQGHRDGWRGHSPVRVGPNARSYAS